MVELKIESCYFQAVKAGKAGKTTELRDRFYQWQTIKLLEIDDSGEFTGDSQEILIRGKRL